MCVCSLTVIDDTTKEVVYRDYIDISVAVATPRVCQEEVGSSGLGFSPYLCEEADPLGEITSVILPF